MPLSVGPRVVIAVLVLAAGCTAPASPTDVEAAPAAPVMALDMATLTNAERSRAGLPAFSVSSPLTRAAQIHAEQMASLGQMSHVLPGARYPEPADRLSAVGYQWSAYAENVAYGQGSAAGVLDSWMDSSGHRANILNASLTQLGTGYARDAAGRPYYVQVFGRPR